MSADWFFRELFAGFIKMSEPSAELKAAVLDSKSKELMVRNLEENGSAMRRSNIMKLIQKGNFAFFQLFIDHFSRKEDADVISQAIAKSGHLSMMKYLVENHSDFSFNLEEALHIAVNNQKHHLVRYLLLLGAKSQPSHNIRYINSYINLAEQIPADWKTEVKEYKTIYGVSIPSSNWAVLKTAASYNLLVQPYQHGELAWNNDRYSHWDARDGINRTTVTIAVFKQLEDGLQALNNNEKLLLCQNIVNWGHHSFSLPIAKYLCELEYPLQELALPGDAHPPHSWPAIYINCNIGVRRGKLSDEFKAKMATDFPAINDVIPSSSEYYSKIIKQVESASMKYLIDLGAKRVKALFWEQPMQPLGLPASVEYWTQATLYNNPEIELDEKPGLPKQRPSFTLSHLLEVKPVNEYALIYAIRKISDHYAYNEHKPFSDPKTANIDENEMVFYFLKYYRNYLLLTSDINNDYTHWLYSQILKDSFIPSDKAFLIEQTVQSLSLLELLLHTLPTRTAIPEICDIITGYADLSGLTALILALYGRTEGYHKIETLSLSSAEHIKDSKRNKDPSSAYTAAPFSRKVSTPISAKQTLSENNRLPETKEGCFNLNDKLYGKFFGNKTPRQIHEKAKRIGLFIGDETGRRISFNLSIGASRGGINEDMDKNRKGYIKYLKKKHGDEIQAVMRKLSRR